MNTKWISDILNSQLLMTISMMVFTIILLVIINKIFDRHRKLKVVFLGTILIIGVALSYLVYEKKSDINSVLYKNYVYGEIKVSSSGVRKIQLDVSQTNIKGIYQNDVVIVSMIQNCKIYNSKNQEVKFEQLEYGDVVKIYCKEKKYNKLDDSKLTGVRILVKTID